VILGEDKTKLLVNLKPGGLCLLASQVSTCDVVCAPTVTRGNPYVTLHGLFDVSKQNNPYRTYTMIQNLYCSYVVIAFNASDL
jgi:hypothetical protein